ncbi:protein SOSEKI 1 [Gastrolobium bilobum]|uniref:protein SOSEKI 1 n=1 Tax=Gastrolobium bilobum TaxID=150636 RepID=UPI002AB295B1|nr:protein SOSEKI 1 [Gastrolobium bilobum]
MEAKGGEVRRLHIIYFLSHMGGHADQPHLIRVLHLARNGVYLRDVKRWLGDLRGKDMPEAFAWSYKRRYKTGFVWQDLLDDDLITPVSDNEYVLKGSQIHPSPFETPSLDEKKTVSDIMAEKESPQAQVVEDKQQQQQQPSPSEEEPQIQRNPDSKTDTPTKGSSEISQDSLVFSSERSSVTDDYSSKVEEEKLLGTGKECFNEQNHHEKKLENCSLPSLYHNLLSKKGNKIDQNKTSTPDSSFSTTSSSSSSSQSSFAKIRSNSTRVSKVFRNWISCGNVETNDAALVLMNGAQKNVFKDPNNIPDNKAVICKGDKLGGSARCSGTSWIHHHQQSQKQQYGSRKSFDGEETNRSRKTLGEFMNIQKPYKPFGGPTCSQCGKTFKPEKMHKHMKSCKGIRSVGTSAATAEKTQLQKSPTSTCEDHLLTN